MSASSHKRDDFDAIARPQLAKPMLFPGHHSAVDLDRETPVSRWMLFDQPLHRAVGGDLDFFAVQDDLHRQS